MLVPRAQADADTVQPPIYARLYAGGGYAVHDNTYYGGEHNLRRNEERQHGAAMLAQADLGVRLLPNLRLHTSLILHGAPDTNKSDREYFDLYTRGFGGGFTANFGAIEFGMNAGMQWTNYLSDYSREGTSGSQMGAFFGAMLGYVFTQSAQYTAGFHTLLRYHVAKDYEYNVAHLRGFAVGAAFSLGFEGMSIL